MTIYESANGGFFVHPEGQRWNWEARFSTRAEAEAYVRNPPPPPKELRGITVLDGFRL